MSLDAMVGFSVNLEQIIRVQENWESRKPLAESHPLNASGTSFNVALAMARAGLEVKLLGTVGENDPLAGTLEHLISKTGLDPMFFPIRESTPITYSLIIPEDQAGDTELRQKLLRCKPKFRNHGAVEQAQEQIRKQLELCEPHYVVATGVSHTDLPLVHSMFHLPSDRGPIYRVFAPSMELIIKERGLISDPKWEFECLALNNYEAAALLNLGSPDDLDKSFVRCRLLAYAPEVVLTCNSHGAYYMRQDRGPETEISSQHQPSYKAEVVDETGAGDCFLAYFLACKMSNGDIKHCLEWAAAAAALKVTRLGGSNMPTREEVNNFLAAHRVTA